MSTVSTVKKSFMVVKYFRLIDFHIYDESESIHEKPTDSSSDDENKPKKPYGNDLQFVIQMFGINEKGETCSLFVNDYQPFFYIKVGDDWTDSTVSEFMMNIKQRKEIRYHAKSIVSAKLVDRHKLYGFTGGKKEKFIQISFKNTTAMNKVKNLWYNYNNKTRERYLVPIVFKGISLQLYESNIPPLLRYFHIHNISPSGWVYIKVKNCIEPETRTTTCNFEYICSQTTIVSSPEKETRVPYKICSFDIEASSSHGDFPLPIKSYKRLASNIVDLFKKQMCVIDISRANTLLMKIIMTAFEYDSFDDVDVVYPISRPTKNEVTKLTQYLLNTPILDTKLTDVADPRNIALTIETMFEKIREMQGNGNNNADDDSDSEEPSKESVPKWKPPPKSSEKIEKKTTIINMLLNNDIEREEKIQLTNELLCKTFPKLEGDQVTFIGSTFLKYGESEPYLNHCIVLGSCDNVNGAVIEPVETEYDLLLRWTQLIQEENPDIIIGYNIFGFDYEFMFRRAQENYCEHEFLLLSRKVGDLCGTEVVDKNDPYAKPEMKIESTNICLASGEYELKYFKMAGRIQIDMYTYFRRDFNLSSYKLDDVAGQFISDDVRKINYTQHIEHGEVTELYSQNLSGLNVGDFIHIEITEFTSDYYQNGQKFRVVDIQKGRQVTETIKGKEVTNTYNIIVIAGRHEIETTKSIKWGMSKDDVTPQDIFRLTKGSSADRAIVAKYCIQDCNLVHHLMNKIDVITGYVEMSRICSVPISFLVFRGQGIKLTSYVAKKCREKNTLMPDLEKSRNNGGYEGAIVLPPKCSMYMDNPVACVDYASLYPSSMISQNYSHDSKVWTKEYNLNGVLIKETGDRDASGNFIYDNLPEYQYINIEFDTYQYIRKTETSKAEKTKSGKMVCRWAQLPNNNKSIMPSILEELLKARADTRKTIKTTKDPFMQNILDKRQLGYKVTANSLYGQCGASTSTFYEKDVAASTTATGRMMITYAKRIIEEVYGDLIYDTQCHGEVKCKAEYVYGDTDSVFFTFNLEDPKTGEKIRGKPALESTIEIAQDAAILCTQYLKAPMELTYEKTLMPFILLSKKRYVGTLYETDPNKGKLKYMGLVLKRRDNCDLVKDIYGGILNVLMKENNVQNAIDFLDKSLDNLINGNVGMDKLMITKALRSDYKNPQQIAHRVLADRMGRRDPGNKPKPGDRIKYLFVTNPDKKALQGEKIETPEYIISNHLDIDYTYYITNQLMKPLQQLFGLALEQIWEKQNKRSAITAFNKDMIKLNKETNNNLELFMKKKEKYCSMKVKTLLFDKFLTKIFNAQNHIQTLAECYSKKP